MRFAFGSLLFGLNTRFACIAVVKNSVLVPLSSHSSISGSISKGVHIIPTSTLSSPFTHTHTITHTHSHTQSLWGTSKNGRVKISPHSPECVNMGVAKMIEYEKIGWSVLWLTEVSNWIFRRATEPFLRTKWQASTEWLKKTTFSFDLCPSQTKIRE